MATIKRDHTRIEGDLFHALNDVSFEVNRGAIVGVIGRNGAGKSTLLKVISRITAPTRGYIGLKGRVASLLEVGTGFHPELTGRENIFLNGSILGMSKLEIKKKFESIEATNKMILTTEKDAVRLVKFNNQIIDLPIYVLPIRHSFLFGEGEAFNELVCNFIWEFKKQELN